MPGDFHTLGKLLIGIGGLVALVGIILIFADRVPWLGRLPGDLYIKRDGFSLYFPIATSILISVILSVLFWLFRR